LRKISFKTINSSTILLPQGYSVLEELKLTQTVIPRDVSTRWNSTCDMLDYCCNHKKAVRLYTQEDADNALSVYALSKKEWKIAEQLRELLKDATLFFSRSTPSLATVIPLMDYINSEFDKMFIDTDLDPAIRAAVSLAKATINKYHNKTSDVYQIAMGNVSL
ncbi:hypothetical protein K435DRAFT_557970, partial [Dendrothele bispora CBS 962.96]